MIRPDNVDVLDKIPMAPFSIGEIRSELKRLEKILAVTCDEAPEMDDGEWQDLIAQLLRVVDDREPEISFAEWVRVAQGPSRMALAFQVRRGLKALQYARRWKGPAHMPTDVVLLPASFSQRLDYLLGTGVLPLAWICRLDLLRFSREASG